MEDKKREGRKGRTYLPVEGEGQVGPGGDDKAVTQEQKESSISLLTETTNKQPNAVGVVNDLSNLSFQTPELPSPRLAIPSEYL